MKKVMLCLALFIPIASFAQVDDVQSWNSVSISKRFKADIKIEWTQEIRLKNRFQTIDENFTHLEVGYKFTKFFDVSLGYRFRIKRLAQSRQQLNQRFDLNLFLDQSVNRFTFDYRTRYSFRNNGFLTENDQEQTHFVRNKLRVKYNIKGIKLTPYFSTELFYRLEEGEENSFSKIRNNMGCQYKFAKRQRIALHLMLEKELNRKNNELFFILGLGYQYKLK